MKITISGPIGSGKSSVGRKLADILKFRFFSGGTFFRQLAQEYGMSLEKFNVYAEKHVEIDKKQDNLILDFIRENDNIVVESRLAGWLCHENSVESFRIFIDAPFSERTKRVSHREKSGRGKTADMVREREESELKRYMDFYGIDYRTPAYYDLIINTENLSVDQVVNKIYEHIAMAGKLP